MTPQLYPCRYPSNLLEDAENMTTTTLTAADFEQTVADNDIVLVDFWASWCGPCLKSLPLLEELQQEFGGDAFQVVGVNLDKDPAKGRRFLKKISVSYPSATDPSGKIPETFGLETMPTSYIVDREGVIRHVHRGFRRGDMDDLRERIAALVKGSR